MPLERPLPHLQPELAAKPIGIDRRNAGESHTLRRVVQALSQKSAYGLYASLNSQMLKQASMALRSFAKKFSFFLLLFGVVILQCACSARPNDKELLRALVNGDPLNEALYHVQDVERLNGFDRGDSYDIEFRAQLVLLESPPDFFTRVSANPIAGIALSADAIGRWGLDAVALLGGASKGSVIPVTGTVSMIRSEKGWIRRP